jgi:ATP-dependent Clp protease adaptor protein ClpS
MSAKKLSDRFILVLFTDGMSHRDFKLNCSDHQRSDDSEVIISERTSNARPKLPPQYKVILLNDDYTSMDFVVTILELIFGKSPSEAVKIMHLVHVSGRGIAGVYAKEIAEAKLSQVHKRARAASFPLRGILEEE